MADIFWASTTNDQDNIANYQWHYVSHVRIIAPGREDTAAYNI